MNMASIFDRPEYLHVELNHFPLIGLLVAMISLACALALRNRNAILVGLALLGLLALSVWIVTYFGEEGFDRVLSMADENGQGFLRYHQELAERWVFLYYLCAGTAALGVGLAWKWPRWLTPLALLALVFAVASFVAGIFIARSGGEIRHREFRSGPPPAVTNAN